MVITTLLYIDELSGISNRKIDYTHTAKHTGTTVFPSDGCMLQYSLLHCMLIREESYHLNSAACPHSQGYGVSCSLLQSLRIMSQEWILNHLVHVNSMTGKQQAPAMKQVNTRWLLSRQHINEDKTAASPTRSKSGSSRLICLTAKNERLKYLFLWCK